MASQQDSVPFEHGAAGHDGLTSNASGTILTKPCTAAEIAFYESAASDPARAAFYAHMPTFIGALHPASADQQSSLSKLLSETDGVGDIDAKATIPAPPSSSKDTANKIPQPKPADAKKPQPTSNDTSGPKKDWTPSGGAKLRTGLAICLENTASGMRKPCVLDLKLGARLWDDAAPQAKRQKLDDVASTTTSGSLGFRVAGMKVYRKAYEGRVAAAAAGGAEEADAGLVRDEEKGFVEMSADGYKTFDKFYGRQFKGAEDVRLAFEAFLPPSCPGSSSNHRQEVGQRFLRELQSVQFVLENTESRMYSASLLFVYEGDADAFAKATAYEARKAEAVEAARAARRGKNAEGGNNDDDEDNDDDEEEIVVDVDDDAETDENGDVIEPRVADLRLIDFAHARWAPGEGPDENALRGVRSALHILEEVLRA